MQKVMINNPAGINANGDGLFRFALADRQLRDLLLDNQGGGSSDANDNGWSLVRNDRFVIKANHTWIKSVAEQLSADVVIVTLTPALAGYHEKMRTTADNQLAGIRRYYSDSFELRPVPDDWPHMLFIRTSCLKNLTAATDLTGDFKAFLAACDAGSMTVTGIAAGGKVLDLDREEDLLIYVSEKLRIACPSGNTDGPSLGDGARVVGHVLFGDNVTLGRNALVIGPAVIGDNVRIRNRAVVSGSIIGDNITIPKKAVVQNRVIPDQTCCDTTDLRRLHLPFSKWQDDPFTSNYFRTWPAWSYARHVKRLFDIVAASFILLMFMPVFPVVVLAIKLSSPGPVFYRARRQGLQGREFDCLKFRSMMATAEDLQEKLRIVNQVDGPQFKMENDPRINAVGKFLRDTNIDEIPQFINVLKGDMSIIGPRPSPEHENTGCPQWRYARLSVRPGITGLWQICRTREEGKDFQEWIQYDTEYVKKLSFKLDVWIFFKTAHHLIHNFLDQF